MDEDKAFIDTNIRNEKIKNFFSKNKKMIVLMLSSFLVLIIFYFSYSEYKNKIKLKFSDKYNLLVAEYSQNNKNKTKNALVELIKKNDSTYSPLSLYFIIDNQLITDNSEINQLFDSIIQDTPLKKEIKKI